MEKFSPGKKHITMKRDQVRAVDDWAVNTIGIPGVVLMENAGRSCAEFIKEKLAKIASPKICVFCGTGNNGGDGFVIARHLINSSFKVTVVLCGDINKVTGDAKINLDILAGMGQSVEQLNLKNVNIASAIHAFGADTDMLIDAIFGPGLNGALNDEHKRLIEGINSLSRSVLAVDIPSGLDCDTGQSLGAVVRAAYTVTFVAAKTGFENSLPPGIQAKYSLPLSALNRRTNLALNTPEVY